MMNKEEIKYYNFENTTKWLNFAYFLREEYPFNRKDLENIKAGWGMIIIPRKGIEETIKAKLSDKKEAPLKTISMLYQIPFVYKDKPGVISKNVDLTFRYDKTYKYGEITKNIAECCYFIEKYSKKMNDFYILEDEFVFEFMSYYVINNQWGLGSETVSTFVTENLSFLKDDLRIEVLGGSDE